MNATRTHGASTVMMVGISLLAATACTPSGPADLADTKTLIESCSGPVNSYIAIDGTASSDTTFLDGPRRRAIERELSQVAACGGRAKVVVFSSSSAATTAVFEGGIALSGATDQAKARRLRGAVGEVADRISSAFVAAVPTLDANGSDPVAQMRLFAEWAGQVGGGGQFRLLDLTDGFQNIGVSTSQIVADPTSAANTFPVPDLAHTDVTFAGIGEVSGAAPDTTVVDGLKAFYDILCRRSGAAHCTVVTEMAGATS
ncbi:hypothetical protein [Mycobacteroides abscessus]|uniref:hypothetical protein n=1 Tax=Mycobacteroides abscessus TaxID=36809 RepID=UPI00187849C1|nr:hypothetical protein [Mycobacteroides abscessus]MDM2085996.1 hypothetical protein [Mycobacteroides abscessus]